MIRPLAVTALALAVPALAALVAARAVPPGYGVRLDAEALIGPPPAPGSAQDRADRAAFGAAPDTASPRWREAQGQVLQFGPETQAQLGCAAGRTITPDVTPATNRLIARSLADLHPLVDAAKDGHARRRPFMVLPDSRSCDFRSLGPLGRIAGGTLSWSWPSGHAAQGRLIALVVADLLPARRPELTAWGDRLGSNRVICRVHWPSDVAAGRRIADAVHARLTALPGWQADAAAARIELATAPAPRCAGTSPA